MTPRDELAELLQAEPAASTWRRANWLNDHGAAVLSLIDAADTVVASQSYVGLRVAPLVGGAEEQTP